MANIFTVKHGEGQPNGILIPFELGFDEAGKKLYIGGAKKADGTLGDAIPIAPTLADLGITASVSELNKLDGLTASTTELNILDGVTATATEINKLDGITASTVELNYCTGVTGAIQTQLNGKQASITGAATTITRNNLTANQALISNASGKVAVSAVTSTELGYLDGVTSAIQTQLNDKANKAGYTASRALVSDSSGNLTVSSTITTAELGCLDGVTKNIQNQLNEKVSIATFDSGLTSTGTSDVGIITMGNLAIEYGLFTANTTWTPKYFATIFSDIPALSFIPIGSGQIAQVKLQNTSSVTTKGFTVSTVSGSATYRYVAIGLVDN